jgi:hypothetical protein
MKRDPMHIDRRTQGAIVPAIFPRFAVRQLDLGCLTLADRLNQPTQTEPDFER